MKVKELTHPISPELSQEFTAFERHFSYPLGDSKRFSIDHGDDYNAFYRAMGNARTYYIEKDNQIIGAIGGAIKEVQLANGEEIKLAYVGDLKIIPSHRRGRWVLHLLKAAHAFIEQHATMAYCVVMDGTDAVPPNYTGRMGIPAVQPIATRYILRFSTQHNQPQSQMQSVDRQEGWKLFQTLSPICPSVSADYSLRSYMTPHWLSNQEAAIGMLEDTRKAKRLYSDDGQEMVSSHLSYFAFANPQAGEEIIINALSLSNNQGSPAMFLALDEQQFDQLKPHIADLKYEVATATIYCTGELPNNYPINTSEI